METPSDSSYRLIELTQGQFAKVDATDYEWLMQWKWCAKWCPNIQGYYAERAHGVLAGTVSMHRQILGLQRGDRRMVDHRFGDGLDNRRALIRIATPKQNAQNAKRMIRNTSGHKGVSWNKECQKWQVSIYLNGKNSHLGRYADLQQAAEIYRLAAVEHFGEFARV